MRKIILTAALCLLPMFAWADAQGRYLASFVNGVLFESSSSNHPETLVQNAKAAGYPENKIEVWVVKQDNPSEKITRVIPAD